MRYKKLIDKRVKIIIPSYNCSNKLISVVQNLRTKNIFSEIYIIHDNSSVKSKLILNYVKINIANIRI